jgi:hypothetical protein
MPLKIVVHQLDGWPTRRSFVWESWFRRSQFLSVDWVDSDSKIQTPTRNPEAWGTLIS